MNIELLVHSAETTPHESSRKRKLEADTEESDHIDSDSVFSRGSTSSTPLSEAPSPDGDLVGKKCEPQDEKCVTFKQFNASNSHITNCETLFKILTDNWKHSINVSGIKFVDEQLELDQESATESARKLVVQRIHNKYVEPLLDLTGYKWVRKEVPPKGRGLKVLSLKYSCSQQVRRRLVSLNSSTKDSKKSVEEDACRSRQLSHPLKQYNCESHYSIKYTWATKTIEISYKHVSHSPFKRLPEKLKPFILKRLDMKAMELYQEILALPEFEDIKELIFFSKVQSFWSKERNRKKVEHTKEAFKKFLSQ